MLHIFAFVSEDATIAELNRVYVASGHVSLDPLIA